MITVDFHVFQVILSALSAHLFFGAFVFMMPPNLVFVTSQRIGDVYFYFGYGVSYFQYWKGGGGKDVHVSIVSPFFLMEILCTSVMPCLLKLVLFHLRCRGKFELLTTPFKVFRYL